VWERDGVHGSLVGVAVGRAHEKCSGRDVAKHQTVLGHGEAIEHVAALRNDRGILGREAERTIERAGSELDLPT
jgi:hypothetical protein